MLFKFIFKNLSDSKKMNYLREHGISLGTRVRKNRKVFLYMVKDFFVEVLYKNDNTDSAAESLGTFSSLEGLNSYLEKDFKTSF